jgi:hypothetical protein
MLGTRTPVGGEQSQTYSHMPQRRRMRSTESAQRQRGWLALRCAVNGSLQIESIYRTGIKLRLVAPSLIVFTSTSPPNGHYLVYFRPNHQLLSCAFFHANNPGLSDAKILIPFTSFSKPDPDPGVPHSMAQQSGRRFGKIDENASIDMSRVSLEQEVEDR